MGNLEVLLSTSILDSITSEISKLSSGGYKSSANTQELLNNMQKNIKLNFKNTRKKFIKKTSLKIYENIK